MSKVISFQFEQIHRKLHHTQQQKEE